MPNLLRLPGRVDLQAARPAGAGTFTIDAYGGGVMSPEGFGPVVLDLAGLRWDGAVPVLADHANELAAVIGTGAPAVEGGKLVVRGPMAPGAAADRAKALAAAGVALQASVGAHPEERQFVPPGETFAANGREFTAGPDGLTWVKRALLKEVSILPLGADGTTSVTIAARMAAGGGSRMTFEEWVKSLGFDPATLSTEQRSALEAVYQQTQEPGPAAEPAAPVNAGAGRTVTTGPTLRADTARRILARQPDLLVQATREGWGEPELVAAAEGVLRAGYDRTPNALTHRDRTSGPDQLAAAIMIRAGYARAAERAFGADALNRANDAGMIRASLVDLCATALRADGVDVPRDRHTMIRAAFSTGSMPVALGSSADKIVADAYRSAPATWRSWCAVKPAANFRTHTAVRPSFAGALEPVGATGEIGSVSYGEDTFDWSVDTYAANAKIDRKAVVNDDLKVFTDVLPTFGRKAERALAKLIYTKLLGNAGSFFHTDNGNYQSGGPSALSSTSLGVAVRQLRKQTDDDGDPLDLAPVVLLVPAELEVTGRGLLNSAEVMRDVSATDLQPTGNTFEGLAKLEVEPRLSTSTYTNYSATGWYLFAGPADMPMIVGFLDGNEIPVTETFGLEHDINTLAMGFRVYFDFGAALGDPKAAQKSAGA